MTWITYISSLTNLFCFCKNSEILLTKIKLLRQSNIYNIKCLREEVYRRILTYYINIKRPKLYYIQNFVTITIPTIKF